MKADPSLLSVYLGIARRTPEESVLRLLAELGVTALGADEGSLLVLDRERQELVFAMTVGPRESEARLRGQRVPLGRGLSGLAAATGEVQIGAPVYKDIRQRRRAGAAGGHPAWVLAAPMMVRDEVVGVFTAANFDPQRPFRSEQAALYAKVASVAGVVVEQNRRLREMESLANPAARPARPRRGPGRRQELLDEIAALAGDAAGREAELLALIRAIRAMRRRP
jgi:GAF domain-containing protein